MKGDLDGVSVALTRETEASAALAQRLGALGAKVIEVPTIRFQPPTDSSRLLDALRRAASFDWLVFTSARGVDSVAQAARKMGLPAHELLAGPRVAAVGPATADAVTALGLPVHFRPTRFLTSALGQELPLHGGQRLLLLRAEVASTELVQILRDRGGLVEDVAAYRTVPDEGSRQRVQQLLSSPPDWILFTSASTVEGFVHLARRHTLTPPGPAWRAACIGPVTAEAARRAGFTVACVAEEYTEDGIVAALVEKVTQSA